ncbi:MAG: hypothetical protein ABI340_09660 [Nitrososphaera sp.]|jgi:hypothetical protein
MKILLSTLFACLIVITTVSAYAQQPQLASYRETAHILVDEMVQNQTTAFITLSSTSPVEMRVPTDLNEKIQGTANVTSVVITNANNCVLGVQDQDCVLVNIVSPALIETYNITDIQSSARKIGDSLIDNINKAFSLNAEFNSVYVTPKAELNKVLGTSGVVSGNRTISVIYTMPSTQSSYLFDGLTAVLIPKQIRDDGGFYSVAQTMAQDANSTVTFAITPGQNASLYQLQVAKHFPIKNKITEIKPLQLFGVDKLDKSSYFNVGFFPLNSIFQVVVLSNENLVITGHGGTLAPTEIKNNQKVPTDLTKSGWVFDPESGHQIGAVYLFGTGTSVTDKDLYLTIGSASGSQIIENTTNTTTPPKLSIDDSTYVIIGIIVAGGAAIYLFMRRR